MSRLVADELTRCANHAETLRVGLERVLGMVDVGVGADADTDGGTHERLYDAMEDLTCVIDNLDMARKSLNG